MLGTFPVSSVPLSSIGVRAAMRAEAGSYLVTGQSATTAVGSRAATGAYVVAGQAARFGVVMRVDPGAYVLTGFAATLRDVDNLRLRGRDFSGYQFLTRDDSEGYW
jgi:hypothetical protein